MINRFLFVRKRTVHLLILLATAILMLAILAQQGGARSPLAQASPNYACDSRVCGRCCIAGSCKKCPEDDGGGEVYFPPVLEWDIDCVEGANNWCVGGTPKLYFNAADRNGFLVSITSSNPARTCIGSTPGTVSCQISLPIGSGTSTLTAYSAASGLGDMDSAPWKYDPNDPVITRSISGDTPSGGWYHAAVTLNASASDAVSGVQSFVVRDNGTVISVPRVLNEGTHSLTFHATDRAGNAASDSLTVRVDVSPPVLSYSLSTAPNASGWHMAAPRLNASSSDTLSGVASLSITDNGSPLANGATLADGVHAIVLTTRDTAGNVSTQSFTVQVDSMQPEVTPILSGTMGENNWYRSPVTVDASFTDLGSGVGSTSALYNGVSVTLPYTIVEDGSHVLIFNAADRAGNAVSLSAVVQIDQQPPVIAVQKSGSGGENGWYRGQVEVQFSATDAVSGPRAAEHRVDDGLWRTGMFFSLSGEGVHQAGMRVFDQAGNAAEVTEVIPIDDTPPQLAFVSPAPNTVAGGRIALRGNAADALAGMDFVQVSLDDGATWRALDAGDWNVDWDVSALPNGARSALLRGVDRAGNAASLSLPVWVDTEGPRIRVSEPWTFDLAGALQVTPNGYPIGTVSVVIESPQGNVLFSKHYRGEVPSFIWWGAVGQPAGEYPVRVTACDVHQVCTQAHSAVAIPFFAYVTPVPTSQPQPLPTVAALPPEEPSQVEGGSFTGKLVGEVRIPVSIALVISLALWLLFLALSVFDPRPAAIHALARTLRGQIR